MRHTSFKVRVVAWNLAVLAVAFLTFGALLGVANVNRLKQDIDRDLEQRGRRIAGLERLPPGARPPNGGPLQNQPFDGVGPSPYQGPNRFPQAQGSNMPGGPFGTGPNGPPEAPRGPIYDLRRPRFFDMQGKPLGNAALNQPFDSKVLMRAIQSVPLFSIVEVDGEPVRVYSAPWMQNGERVGGVQLARELRDVELLQAGQLRTLLLLLPFALVASGAGAFFLASRVIKPIGELTNVAKKISSSDLQQRIAVDGDDELADLGRTFNTMLDRLKQSFDDLENSLEKQRQFTADASHELRTPLTRLRLATSAALAGPPSEYPQALERADRAAENMSRLVEQLLTLAQADAHALPATFEPLDLRVPVAEAVDAFRSDQLELAVPDTPVLVISDADLTTRLVRNLVENALRHTPEGNLVRVSLRETDTAVELQVSDEGEGIPEKHLPNLFERFYRVDAARARELGGTGLGLAICKTIVEAMEGTISVESKVGVGTTFSVFLPLSKKVVAK